MTSFQHRIHYHSNILLQKCIFFMALLSFFAVIYGFYQKPLGTQADFFLLAFSGLTLILVILEQYAYTPFFLLSNFTFITSWRLSALAQYTLASNLYLIVFIFIFLQFFICIKNDFTEKKVQRNNYHLSKYEWQLLFVRMYLGYDLIPHFCEKLFAGTSIRADDLAYFSHIGLNHPLSFVILAGLIELAGAISISCGFITRLGAICLFIYLIVASILGNHFHLGFIWANNGGGWEYPVLWAALVLSFAFTGANTFSMDEYLSEKYTLPKWLKRLMGSV